MKTIRAEFSATFLNNNYIYQSEHKKVRPKELHL